MLKAIPAAFRSLEGGQGVFLDDTNRVLVSGQRRTLDETAAPEADPDGGEWFLGTMPGGGTRLSYLLPLEYPDWKVGVRVPEAFAFRAALETGLRVGLFALVMALLIEALALFIAQQITLPAAAARRIGRPDRRRRPGADGVGRRPG